MACSHIQVGKTAELAGITKIGKSQVEKIYIVNLELSAGIFILLSNILLFIKSPFASIT